MKHGITAWLDEWELRPGLRWQAALEQQIPQIQSVVIFVGESGVGPWQQVELDAILREFVARQCPVIPVILPGAPSVPSLPLFLRDMTWIDFRRNNPRPIQQLIWGITGKRFGKEMG